MPTLLPISSESQIRLTGLIYQLLGFTSVLFCIYSTTNIFTNIKPIIVIRSWFKRFPKLPAYKQLSAVSGNFDVNLGGKLGANFVGHVTPSKTAPLEKWVEHLKERIEETNTKLDDIDQKLERTHNDLLTKINKERSERIKADQSNKELIQNTTTNTIYLEFAGVIWFVIGIILATASAEISALLI